jgi:hypothetical protein
MKSWIRLAALLYPKAWRQRYGREFESLVEDTDPLWRDIWDVARSAVEMQMATWSIAKIAGIAGVAGALIATGLASRIPHQYAASGAVQSAADLRSRLPGLEREVLSRRFLSTVVAQEDLYKAERRDTPMEEIADRMRSEKIHITAATNGVVQVSFLDEDPARAQRVAHWILNQIVYVEPSLRVAALPAIRSEPVAPSRWPRIGWGLAIGLAAGACAGWLWRRPLQWTLRMATFVIVGGLAGFGMFYCWWFGFGPGALLGDAFTSTAVVRTTDSSELQARMMSSEVLQAAIQNADLYRRRAESAVELVRRDLRLTRLVAPGSELLTVRFTYSDRYKAQLAVRSIVTSASAPGMEVIDPASLSELGAFREWHFIGLGILFGLCAAMIRLPRRPQVAAPQFRHG